MKSRKRKVAQVVAKAKEKGRGSPDRCDSKRDRKNCLRKCHVWPCWNAVKTCRLRTGREKPSPSCPTVQQMGYFGPGSAELAIRLHARVRVCSREHVHLENSLEDSLHVFRAAFLFRVAGRERRFTRKGKKFWKQVSPPRNALLFHCEGAVEFL